MQIRITSWVIGQKYNEKGNGHPHGNPSPTIQWFLFIMSGHCRLIPPESPWHRHSTPRRRVLHAPETRCAAGAYHSIIPQPRIRMVPENVRIHFSAWGGNCLPAWRHEGMTMAAFIDDRALEPLEHFSANPNDGLASSMSLHRNIAGRRDARHRDGHLLGDVDPGGLFFCARG